MRISLLSRFSLIILPAFFILSCNKKENFQTESINDYMPLAVGKYITYRVDSTVFTNFQRSVEIHSYQVKHVIEAELTDNLGRPAYRVYRYIRDTAGTQSWQPNGSYFITPLENSAEVVENNLRVIKLHLPIKDGYSWKGNSYLGTEPYQSLYSFSNDLYMKDWDFYYKDLGSTYTYGSQTVSNVLTVQQADDNTVPDTFRVVNNAVTISTKSTPTVWIKGTATDTILLSVPSSMNAISVVNASNYAVDLNGIYTPPNFNRDYEKTGNTWTFGGGKDTVIQAGPAYTSFNFSADKYAKSIGLVYHELVMWELQPNPTGNSPNIVFDPTWIGFGIKMRMIDHN